MKYLKGLDTLRAIASCVVVWGHIELLKLDSKIVEVASDNLYNPSGHLAVILFFVISGFLITYLMTNEIDSTSTLNLKRFYLKRIFRIWPLYYLIIILSILFITSDYSIQTYLLCLSIFPNVAHALDVGWGGSPQIWSIGVEEQFYLFWPLILMLLKPKRAVFFLIFFVLVFNLAHHFVGYYSVRNVDFQDTGKFLYNLFHGARFDSMAIGSILGILCARNLEKVKLLVNPLIGIISCIVLISFWGFSYRLPIFNEVVFSLACAVLIYNVVFNLKVNIDFKITSFIGKISYGIYMYHWIILLLVLKYLPFDGNLMFYNIELYGLTFGITILISWISHVTFEKYFLNLKNKF